MEKQTKSGVPGDRTVLVLATSFLDSLRTHPAGEGSARKALDGLASSHSGLRIEYRCDRDPAAALSPDEFHGVVAVIADLERYTREFLLSVGPKNGGTLGLIARYGVGYDSIDIPAATEAGILVTNTPGANSRPTAEWSVSTLLSVAGRRIPHHEQASRGRSKTGPSRLDISGKVLGVVGTGNIGRTVVELLQGFHLEVLAHDPYPNREWAKAVGARYVTLDELCTQADFITLHAAHNATIIGSRELDLMKPTTVLINCARAVLVDNREAHRRVSDGRLWGYGLDEIWTLDDLPLAGLNIATSPHVGADTDMGKLRMQIGTAECVSAFVEGRRPNHVVNAEVGP